MAKPLPTGKKSVDLAKPDVRVSKIRRDPPPAVKELRIPAPEESDQRMVVLGVLLFTLALIVILIGFSSATGWSPREYIVHI